MLDAFATPLPDLPPWLAARPLFHMPLAAIFAIFIFAFAVFRFLIRRHYFAAFRFFMPLVILRDEHRHTRDRYMSFATPLRHYRAAFSACLRRFSLRFSLRQLLPFAPRFDAAFLSPPPLLFRCSPAITFMPPPPAFDASVSRCRRWRCASRLSRYIPPRDIRSPHAMLSRHTLSLSLFADADVF